MLLNWMIGSFCDSKLKYVAPILGPINPINIINWIFLGIIFAIVILSKNTFLNSTVDEKDKDKRNKSFLRSFLTAFSIYYIISVIIYLILILTACQINEYTPGARLRRFNNKGMKIAGNIGNNIARKFGIDTD
jgi:hypothetical protein